LEAVVAAHKAAGTFDAGIVQLKGQAITVDTAHYPKHLHTDPSSGASTNMVRNYLNTCMVTELTAYLLTNLLAKHAYLLTCLLAYLLTELTYLLNLLTKHACAGTVE
jgi:hypothetical protein